MPSAVVAVLGFLLAVPSIPAANRIWNTTDGLWETAGNWNPSGSPISTDAIQIYSNGIYTVFVTNSTADSFPGTMTVSSLGLGDTAGDNMTLLVSFTNTARALLFGSTAIGGGASTPTLRLQNGTVVSSGGLTVGNGTSGLGTMLVEGGTFIGNGIFNLGNLANATGRVTVAGGSMLFTNSIADNFGIGNGGKGIFAVNSGVVRLTAPGNTGLRLGKASGGDGELQIAGGTTEIGGSLSVGYTSGATGLVNVAGGTLVVTNGAGTLAFTIGSASGSKATLSQSGGLILANVLQVNYGANWEMSGGTNLASATTLGFSGAGTFTLNGGLMAVSNGLFTVGRAGGGTEFSDATINNGSLFAATFAVGGNSAGGNNPGSGRAWLYGGTVIVTNALQVGVGGTGSTGTMLVANSGILDICGTTTLGGASRMGTLTNQNGGTLRFSGMNNPTITVNSGSSIVTTNAVIEFANAGAAQTNAFVKLGLQTANTLSLNNATNAVLPSYVFSNNLAFSNLRLIGAAPTWQSTNLFIGTGGALLVSNAGNATISSPLATGVLTNCGAISVWSSTVGYSQQVYVASGATYASHAGTNAFNRGLSLDSNSTYQVDGLSQVTGAGLKVNAGGTLAFANGSASVGMAVTNQGTLSVNNASVVFNAPVLNLGAYTSDPSTNSFNANYTVGPTATVVAAAGDVYAFGADFFMQSSNRNFNMSGAIAYFGTNGYGLATTTASHTLSLSNSAAYDWGHFTNFAMVTTNFSIGTLSIEMSNQVTVAGIKTAGQPTNALYVGVLDIQGLTLNSTNTFGAFSNTLVSALSLPNINVYYDFYNPSNAWLNAYLPLVASQGQQGYEFWGASGGLLIPIPEPSPFMALGAGLGLLAFLRARSRKA